MLYEFDSIEKENEEGKEIFEIDTISIQNLSFRLAGRSELFHDINIEIEKGKFIAIVGESGSRKSTLGQILQRFYNFENVSISKSISPTQLNSIVNYANNAPETYNVNSYACTDFGIAVGKLGGINLPSTKASTLMFSGTSPGNLGEDIKSGTFPSTTKTSSKNNAPVRKGDCK
ncbi:ATP-binding cassette domain-containing protein [Flavobacterium sp. ov086]|uniref:ATP-binding cassette domain-containing protein n=1 Tax=Flavobacterium sp. ov086 TaxID=1761785 RepID=UPI0020CE106A|nr:ATP-binding cassette domain-containing protein [Flavobacterium sp. ov086]